LTLLEVLISLALVALLLGGAMTFFWQTVEVRRQVGGRIDRTQLARQVLARMAEELRCCVGFEQVGFPVEQRLVGDRRSITFLTSALPGRHQYVFYRESDELPPAQHDLTLVSYRLWVDAENLDADGQPIVGGILRTEKKTLNQFVVDEEDPLDQRTDLWSPELGYLEFRYFDGVEWDTKWDITEGNSLPQLVQITVGFTNITLDEYEDRDLSEYPISEYPLGDERPRSDRYSLIVRLPAADRFFGSRVQRIGKKFSEQLGVGGAGGGF
jgi:type II secretory pathway pseudopilin PulG